MEKITDFWTENPKKVKKKSPISSKSVTKVLWKFFGKIQTGNRWQINTISLLGITLWRCMQWYCTNCWIKSFLKLGRKDWLHSVIGQRVGQAWDLCQPKHAVLLGCALRSKRLHLHSQPWISSKTLTHHFYISLIWRKYWYRNTVTRHRARI